MSEWEPIPKEEEGWEPIQAEKEAPSAWRGVLQGLNIGDEAEGVVGAVGDVGSGRAQLTDLLNRYKTHRDMARAKDEEARLANPAGYEAAKLGGELTARMGATAALAPFTGPLSPVVANALVGGIRGLGENKPMGDSPIVEGIYGATTDAITSGVLAAPRMLSRLKSAGNLATASSGGLLPTSAPSVPLKDKLMEVGSRIDLKNSPTGMLMQGAKELGRGALKYGSKIREALGSAVPSVGTTAAGMAKENPNYVSEKEAEDQFIQGR